MCTLTIVSEVVVIIKSLLTSINYSPFFKPILLPFIPQICFCAAQVHDLRTAIAILLHLHALLAIVGIGDTLPSTDSTAALETAEIAFITNLDQGAGSNI